MLTNCGCREISHEPIEFKIQDCPQQVHTDCGPLLPNTNEKDWCKLKNKIIYDFQKVIKLLECGIQPDIELILEEISLIFMNSCGYNIAKKMYATDLEEDYFLRHNNFLSEFETLEEKDLVLINLGIYDIVRNIITRDELNDTIEDTVSQVNITINNRISEVNDIVEELNNKLNTKIGFVTRIDKIYYAFASSETYADWIRQGSNLSSKLILALWVANDYMPKHSVVIFDTMGGNPLDYQIVTEDYSIILPTPTWIDNSKTFAGWYDNVLYTGTKYSGRYTPTESIILYAKWADTHKYLLTTEIPSSIPEWSNSTGEITTYDLLEGWNEWRGNEYQYIVFPNDQSNDISHYFVHQDDDGQGDFCVPEYYEKRNDNRIPPEIIVFAWNDVFNPLDTSNGQNKVQIK